MATQVKTIATSKAGSRSSKLPVKAQGARPARAKNAVDAILELKRSGRKTGITIEDILSARDEGRR